MLGYMPGCHSSDQWRSNAYHRLTMCHVHIGVIIKSAALFSETPCIWLHYEVFKILHVTKHLWHYRKTLISKYFLIPTHTFCFYLIMNNYTGCVSESGDFATLFFSGSATLGQMPLSPFCCQLWSVLVAMEPQTAAQHAFAVKAFYKNGDSFVIVQAWISKAVRDSSQSYCSISPGHQDLGSKLWGYWFYTKEERWWRKSSTYTREYCGSKRDHWKKSTPFCGLLSMVSLTTTIFSGVHTAFTLPPSFFSVEPVSSKFRTQVLMAWADGTARSRWIPNSLQNSHWMITKLPPFL